MDDKLITIATLQADKAEHLKKRLESENIEVCVDSIFSLRSSLKGKVQICINDKDVEKAFRIMTHIKEENEKQILDRAASVNEIEKILVPVDFSEYSLKAGRFAVELAVKTNAEIKIVHVYFLPEVDTIVDNGNSIPYQKVKNEIEDEAKKWINKFIDELYLQANGISSNLNISYEILNGIDHEEIINFSEIYEPDIILMGARGRNNSKTIFIGSVTEKVIDYAKVPVLAIPKAARFESFSQMNRVLYATKFDESDFNAIKKLIKIIKPLDLKVDCVHVSEKQIEFWDKMKLVGLKHYFGSVYKQSDVRCDIIQGMQVSKAFEAYIKTQNIGICALNQQKRNLLTRLIEPKLTHQIMLESDIPLLVFHV